MATTSIEWTRGDDGTAGVVWNPTTGCDRVSSGCDHCYALTMAKRLKGMGQAKYQADGDPRTSGPGFGLAVHEDVLSLPLRWRKPRRIFVTSMSDLFHNKVPAEFIAKVFAVMAATPQHTYQLLTKRHARMRSLLNDPEWRTSVFTRESILDLRGPVRDLPSWPLPNLWLGVSVENQRWANIRIPALLDTPAAVRWLSCEPLLGPVDLREFLWQNGHRDNWGLLTYDECRLHWIVVGGESGPGARPMDLEWVRMLLEQSDEADVSAFVKQLGSRWGRHHHDIDQFPEDLRVREYPASVAASHGGGR